ncbi:MAG: hypothetical protein AAF517_28135 [Planctomycetota bacterium]
MRSIDVFAITPFLLGAGLLLWVFGPEEIYSTHSSRAYLMLCTAIVCIAIGCLASVWRVRRAAE